MRTGVKSLRSALQVVSSNDLEATYAALSRSEYTWEELQQRPLPPGVDPARIESYLSAEAFQVCPSLLRYLRSCCVLDSLLIQLFYIIILCISSNNIFFQEKFSMSKSDYSASPRWKQIEMKKSAGLF